MKDLENCWFPLGEALYDYYHGRLAACITVRSNVEEDRQIPVGAFFREKNKFPYLEKKALKHCKGKVLDVGAGAGTHALYLQNKGLEVDALDISTKAVSVMQSRGVKNAYAADIFSFKTTAQYDTILLMMNGIGIAGTLDGLRKLLAHFEHQVALVEVEFVTPREPHAGGVLEQVHFVARALVYCARDAGHPTHVFHHGVFQAHDLVVSIVDPQLAFERREIPRIDHIGRLVFSFGFEIDDGRGAAFARFGAADGEGEHQE